MNDPPRKTLSPPPSLSRSSPCLFFLKTHDFPASLPRCNLKQLIISLSTCPGAVSHEPNVISMDVTSRDVKIQLTFKSPFHPRPRGCLLLWQSGRAPGARGSSQVTGTGGAQSNWPWEETCRRRCPGRRVSLLHCPQPGALPTPPPPHLAHLPQTLQSFFRALHCTLPGSCCTHSTNRLVWTLSTALRVLTSECSMALHYFEP